MNIVFIHQNAPGQWRHIAAHLAAEGGHKIVIIGKHKRVDIEGADYRLYKVSPAHESPEPGNPESLFASFIGHGKAVAEILKTLLAEGFKPDVIAAHPGWGESIFAKDVLPDVPLLHYCEFYYRSKGADYGFANDTTLEGDMALRARNAGLNLSLEAMDWGVCPTNWQKAQHPASSHDKITVVHEGIDTSVVKPDPEATIVLPTGRILTAQDEVVTYVARNLEPYRGIHIFTRAAELIQRQRPNAHVVLVGGTGVSYGGPPADGRTWKENLLDTARLDPMRTHFLGTLAYDRYLKVLQTSSVHVYLTFPFVLSWSMTESMSAGCLIVGSNTQPVQEVLRHNENGLMVDFFKPEEVAATVCDALENRDKLRHLREGARNTILSGYDQAAHCIPAHKQLLLDLAAGRRPALSHTPSATLGAA
ncbi:glycosyltransferase family 4 protein [Lacibacterium aquatile]|uniref:Glycosyltransferase family 4 protein n=1 Tax=Lacibacterium aquatile TaxID=1168082 RepID=A0ABW5DYC0_9PROT